jgi:hypothetical protein
MIKITATKQKNAVAIRIPLNRHFPFFLIGGGVLFMVSPSRESDDMLSPAVSFVDC